MPPVARRIVPPLRHPHDREIVRLAVPAFGALVAEPLFLLADAAIIGHLGTPQLAGLAAAAAALTFLVSLCVFLAYGTTAAVARRMGAGDLRGAIAHGVDGMWLAAVLGSALAVAAVLLAPVVVGGFGASAEATAHGVTYLRVSAAGIPAMLVVLAATGVLRGLQDTRTPLIVAGVGAAANVGLNVLLVYGAGLGAAGAALGTVLVQVASAAVYVAIVARAVRRVGAALRPRRHGLRVAGMAGVPLLLRTLSLRVGLLLATYVAAQQGDVALATHQIAFAIWGLLAFALDAIAIAGQAIIGRALGAGDLAGARARTRRMVEWGVVAGVALGALVILGRAVYVPWFTADTDVQALLTAILVLVAIQQPIAGVVFVLDGVLIGAGDGRYLAWAGLATLLAFAPLAGLVLLTGSGLPALWWALAAFLVARLLTLVHRVSGSAWLVPGAVP